MHKIFKMDYLNFESYYALMDDDARHIFHVLAICPSSMNINELSSLVNIQKKINNKRLREVLNDGEVNHFTRVDYRGCYLLNGDVLVWLYPLLKYLSKEKDYYNNRQRTFGFYYGYGNKTLFAYLNALWNNSNDLKTNEDEILRSSYLIENLLAIFNQPLYEEIYNRISPKIAELLYNEMMRQTFYQLGPLENLRNLHTKLFGENEPLACTVENAQIAYKNGDFQLAQTMLRAIDSHITYFVIATECFMEGNISGALDMFEKGLKRQRRDFKQSYLPMVPEAALFYLVALLSGEQEKFIPIFARITGPKSKHPGNINMILETICKYMTSNNAELYSEKLKYFSENETVETVLWKIIALWITGEKPEKSEKWIKKATAAMKRAFNNGYLLAAYEASFVLQSMESKDAADIYFQLSEKLKYKPALSQIKRVEEWEKQLNAYLSLNAVKSLIKLEAESGKTRVAYRFYPDRKLVQPILQTRQSSGNGLWTAGRNIAMTNFCNGKVDCMTEQDKRIAATASYYSYYLDRRSFPEMTGHPYIFLENSDILVELIASKPVLNVIELSKGEYKLDSDVADLSNDIYLEKETNTRYKVYTIGEAQREIIQAIKKGKVIPEAGKEKLMKVMEHFSAYLTVQTDLAVGGVNMLARQVETDSCIHVQLLPLGEGLKAELFVKPFGTNPPYCKPGKGGKLLLANQNGERLQVTRNLETEVQYADKILSDLQTIENVDINDEIMTFDNALDALELLEILKRHNDISIIEWPEGERMKVRGAANFENLNLRMKSGIDWFEMEGELQLDEETVISLGQLLELVKRGHGRFIELSNGEFIALSEKFKRRLDELSAFSTVTKKTATINRFATAAMVGSFDDFENLKFDKAWRDFRKSIDDAQNVNTDIPSGLTAELRPYQEEGYRWMTRLAAWGAGACLADDMGLGKTVQAIASLLQRASRGPALVVAPLSVQQNWISETNRFAPTLTVKTLRDGVRSEILASLGAGDLLVISYGLLHSEEEALTSIEWATVILDEAHAIKNYTTKTSKAAMSLKAGFKTVLTGTPLQNHLGEMWNLFQFINPGLLGTLPHFTDNFIKPVDNNARKRLKKLINPFILRRTKSAVLDELPPKTEIIRKIELSPEETAFYETLRRRAIETIQSAEGPQGAKHLKALAEITRLRQACCNPKIVEPKINIGSTKLSTFLEIAAELKDNGHRALVFSQFVTHLSIVRDALDKQGFSYQYLDGSTSPVKREIAVKKFQAGEGDLFLISLKAGGLGLNLTAADFVIHLDPWWNPAIEDQASDRAHRIGQSRPVTVYRLVAEHTIEEKIIRLHNTKRDLADSLLEGSDQSAKLSIEELMALIREG